MGKFDPKMGSIWVGMVERDFKDLKTRDSIDPKDDDLIHPDGYFIPDIDNNEHLMC